MSHSAFFDALHAAKVKQLEAALAKAADTSPLLRQCETCYGVDPCCPTCHGAGWWRG